MMAKTKVKNHLLIFLFKYLNILTFKGFQGHLAQKTSIM